MNYTRENIPVNNEYDVIIAGGGTAGAVAGISAARMGLKTLIIERLYTLGGSQTLGLVMPLMPSHVPDDKSCSAIHSELVNKMHALGHASASTQNEGSWFDPLFMRIILEETACDSGCHMLYNTSIIDVVKENDKIKQLIVHNKGGIMAYQAKCFIDCSGDADVAYLSGVQCHSGNDEGYNQAISLRFEMSDVNIEKLGEFIRKCGQTEKEASRYPGVTSDCSDAPGLWDFICKKKDEGELTAQDIRHFQMFSVPGKPGNVNFNSPELGNSKNVIDPQFLTEKQIEAHKAIRRIAEFCKKNIPGFEKAYISEIAGLMGIRETRRIEAEYMLKCTDVWEYKKFSDGIATSNYPLDVHGATENYRKSYKDTSEEEKYYEISYRSLVPVGISNLLVAGRCLGADFLAQSTARVQHSSRAMGEACGIAAKLLIDENLSFKDVNGEKVREIMAERLAKM